MTKEFIDPAALPNWEQFFTQVITVSAGPARTVYISGQVAVDQDQKLIGEGDLAAQAMRSVSESRNCPGRRRGEHSGCGEDQHLRERLQT